MTGRSVKTLVAAVALAGAITPAAFAEDDAGVGFTCGFVSSTDDTKLVFNDDRQHGEVDCGPLVVANTAGGAIDSVTLCFYIQINWEFHLGPKGTYHESPPVADGGCATNSGNVGVLVDTLDYTAEVGDVVYLCTDIFWTGDKGPFEEHWDAVPDDPADPTTLGEQCAEATSIEGP